MGDIFVLLLALAGGVGLILYFVDLALHALIKRAVKEALREYDRDLLESFDRLRGDIGRAQAEPVKRAVHGVRAVADRKAQLFGVSGRRKKFGQLFHDAASDSSLSSAALSRSTCWMFARWPERVTA